MYSVIIVVPRRFRTRDSFEEENFSMNWTGRIIVLAGFIGGHKVDPVNVQVTAGFGFLGGSNTTADLTGGKAQVVILVIMTHCKYRQCFVPLPVLTC